MGTVGTDRNKAVELSAIGEMVRVFGVTARTLRFYEDEGLLSPLREGTARLYGPRERAQLRLILRGKRLGFSLDEIREFLGLYDADPEQVGQMRFLKERCAERIGLLEQQLADITQTLDELRGIEAEIDRHLEAHAAPHTANPAQPTQKSSENRCENRHGRGASSPQAAQRGSATPEIP